MTQIDSLFKELEATYDDSLQNIQEAKESADRIAVEVQDLELLFKEHEVCIYKPLRCFVVSSEPFKTEWHNAIMVTRRRLKQGVDQVINQLAEPVKEIDYENAHRGMSITL